MGTFTRPRLHWANEMIYRGERHIKTVFMTHFIPIDLIPFAGSDAAASQQ